MNVTCPNCATVYRVDPAKVPEAGVRARCAICSAIFAVHREGAASTGSAVPAAASVPAAAASVAASAPAPVQPPAAPAAPPVVAPAVAPAVASASAPAEASSTAPAPPAHDSLAANPLPQRPVSRPVSGSPIAPPPPAAAPTPPSRPVGPPRPAAPPAFAALARTADAAPVETPPPSSIAQAVPPATPAAARPVNPFLSQDPALKARRLARALISDMVVYHPAKRQEGLRDGT